MYRTDIPPDGGMLFAPYPADGGPPREASFWMKNTPTPARHHLHPRRRHDRADRREHRAVLRDAGGVGRAGRRGAGDRRRARRPSSGIAEGDKVTLGRSVASAGGCRCAAARLSARAMGINLNPFTWWNGATFGTWFGLRGKTRVGEDALGNVYYQGGKRHRTATRAAG